MYSWLTLGVGARGQRQGARVHHDGLLRRRHPAPDVEHVLQVRIRREGGAVPGTAKGILIPLGGLIQTLHCTSCPPPFLALNLITLEGGNSLSGYMESQGGAGHNGALRR